MRITMNYGRSGLPIELDDSWDVTVIAKRPMPTLAEPSRAIAEALDHPIECLPLRDLTRGKTSVCILICDITRPVPNGLILPVLVRQLLEAGMQRDQIRILIATGLHRPNLGDELLEVVGDDWVANNIRVENHYAEDDADHVDLGPTKRGTPVKLDRRLVEADLRIAVGLVEPHFMAGYSGGRKLIMPGIAGHETIRTLHNAEVMGHPLAENSRLEGNPLHEQQLEIVQRLGGALAVNVVIDEHRRIGLVNFGEIVASHAAAVAFVRTYAEVPVPRRYPLVITSAAGYPLDRTYYQTVKGMVAALGALAEGGDLVIVSECSEGLGSRAFAESQKRLLAAGPETFRRSIHGKPLADIDEWQTGMQIKAMRRGRIHLYAPLLPGDQQVLTGVPTITDLPGTIRNFAGKQGAHPAIAVIPEGPYVIPMSA